MNNQLQISWVQPCEENSQISNASFVVGLKNRIQQIKCRINKIDNFANSMNSTYANNGTHTHKVISRTILR